MNLEEKGRTFSVVHEQKIVPARTIIHHLRKRPSLSRTTIWNIRVSWGLIFTLVWKIPSNRLNRIRDKNATYELWLSDI